MSYLHESKTVSSLKQSVSSDIQVSILDFSQN